MNEKLRISGIDIIGDLPWGVHFCQFYRTKEDLTEILVPYFKAGLENNEFCLWITTYPLDSEEAKEALRKTIPDLDIYLENGQIEIIPYNDWYIKEGIFDSERALNGWVEKFDQGLARDYDGLRLGGNSFWLKREDWGNFVYYEKKVDTIIRNYPIIALCTYSLDAHDVTETIDIASNHQFTLVKKEGKWERIENSGRRNLTESKTTEEIMPQNKQNIRLKAGNMLPPAREVANLELADIIDARVIQYLMDDLYKLAHITMALVDLKGNVLVGVGWQDICTKFHRIHPDACKHCVESDIKLSSGVPPGEFKLYKCKNNMWDIATPIIVGNQHVGYAFSGQFFFEDEPLDYELFRSQARHYGFNEEEYIAALERVPRLSPTAVDTGMSFLTTFANMVSKLGYSNLKLAQSLAERETLVDALRESEKRERARSEELEAVLDAVPVTVFIAHDPQALQITGNRLSYEWIRIPVGTNFSKSAPEGKRPEIFSLFKDGVEIQPANMPSQMAAAGIEVNDFELEIISSDGEIRHVLGNARPLRDEQGNLRGSISAFIDITERKKAEETIRLSNLYNRSLIEASLDPLVTIGPDGKITDVNNSTETVTGRSRDELIGTDFSDYFTEPEKAREGYQRAFKEGLVRNYSLEIQHKDGHITPVLYNASVYKDGAGEIIGVFAAARDISELKKAEEKIRTLANAVESSDDAILTKSLDGIITSWNNGAEKIYGYMAEEVLGKNISVLEPDDFKGETKKLVEIIKQGERVHHYETLRMKKDGTIINVSVTLSPVFGASGKLVAISTITRDITENKKAEEALRLSNIYNRSLIEASLDPLVTIGPDGKITDVNGATELVTGYSINDLIGTDFSDYFTEPEKALAGYQQVFNDGEVRDYPLEIQHKDGNITPVLYNASVYRDENGEVIGVFAAARDITERKKAEEAVKKVHDNLEKLVKERTAELEKAYESLKESEQGLAEAQKMTHIGNWGWNLVTGEVCWSEELYRIFGRSPQESGATYDEFLTYVHPDDRDRVNNAIKKGLDGEPIKGDYRIILANGEERIVHTEAEIVFYEENNPIQVKGTVQDITEIKRAEEQIKILANIVESSNDAIGTMSLDGIITSLNQEAEQVYGYSVEEVLGKPVSIFAPPHLDKETIKLIEEIKHGKKVQRYETLRLRKDGVPIYVSITLSPVFDSYGKLIAVSFISRDITERKKIEEKLLESEEKYRNIVETANEGISIIDAEERITFVNKKIEDLFGYSSEELTGRPMWDLLSDESKAIIKQKLDKGWSNVNESFEIKFIRKDGYPIWTHTNSKSLFDKDGKFFGTLNLHTDITKRKEAEEALRNFEIARKKEIHHRIKNNLQVIYSLLDLQAEMFKGKNNIRDSEVLNAFKVSMDRVLSIALIHEELYKGENIDVLNFSQYIKELADNLLLTYRLGTDVSLNLDLEENLFLDMDAAIPLGIIINELVSNSLKYAFPEKDKGEIQIKLRREEKGEYKSYGCKSSDFVLTVSDNGIGIPENLDIEDLDSLGLQLVTSLVDQLDGELEVKRNNGTEFTIKFTVTEKDKQALNPAI